MKNSKGEQESLETTIGRVLFSNILPEGMAFQNCVQDSKSLKGLVKDVFKRYGRDATAQFVDRLKNIGFDFATQSGITISMSDLLVPEQKGQTLKAGDQRLEEIERQYHRGLITEDEKKLKNIELWTQIKRSLEKNMLEDLDEENPVFMMMKSGARGSIAQISQLAGMKGSVVSPTGQIIEVPIRSNYKEGLSALEYFISTHGSRKGKSDTALRTSESGYLTRRLVDVAQDVVVSREDCQTREFIIIYRDESLAVGERFADRLVGRIAAEDIKDPKKGKVMVRKGEEIGDRESDWLENSSITDVKVRSVLTCQADWGICQKCYGRDLATGKLIEIGEAAGIMAAQSIGEPGTQLTMKTFHLGGILGEDITTGLTRVEEVFESRPPRTPAVISEIEGRVSVYQHKGRKFIKVESSQRPTQDFSLPAGYKWIVKNGETVKNRQALAVAVGKKSLRAPFDGRVSLRNKKLTITAQDVVSCNYPISPTASLLFEENDKVSRGQQLTSGHLDLSSFLKLRDKMAVQKYIIGEVKTIYASQGQQINEKHIELIVKQMFSKVKISEAGNSPYLEGQVVDKKYFQLENAHLKEKGQKPAQGEDIVMGITRVALKIDSFLSAASFQETTSILLDAAISGSVDYLRGLKENVIIGKLIPVKTAFRQPQKIEIED